jgi:hypothetical protein
VVEKAAIAINRMYGKVVKINHNMGEFTPPQLCGHLISFRHSGPTAVASSLPNVDFDRLIVVHFIGGKKKWETMMPMLAGSRDHILALRPEVVFAWLVRLKQTHPRYQTMPIDVSDAAAGSMRGNLLRMLEGAMVKEDGAPADDEVLRDNAAESDIARDAAHIGFSDVVLENQEPIDNDASKKAKTLRMLGIDANAAPENEFDDNEGVIAGAFPWVFMFGKVGLGENSGMDNELRKRLLLQYDRRVEREPALIFLLFNQMQRHRATQNIVTAPPDDLGDINALAGDPNIRDIMEQNLARVHPAVPREGSSR